MQPFKMVTLTGSYRELEPESADRWRLSQHHPDGRCYGGGTFDADQVLAQIPDELGAEFQAYLENICCGEPPTAVLNVAVALARGTYGDAVDEAFSLLDHCRGVALANRTLRALAETGR